MVVKISPGNIKMGIIPSVSLPSILTCRGDCECRKKCYAKKLERIRKSVRDAYSANYQLLKEDPKTYWRDVEQSVKMARFFRFHVSGDIPDYDYFLNMVRVAIENPRCEILCFTKKFSIVNQYLSENNNTLPDNLHIVFSGWKNLKMENPYHLPEAHVLYKDGTTTAAPGYMLCEGNCTECATTDSGCWVLQRGQQVVFHEH